MVDAHDYKHLIHDLLQVCCLAFEWKMPCYIAETESSAHKHQVDLHVVEQREVQEGNTCTCEHSDVPPKQENHQIAQIVNVDSLVVLEKVGILVPLILFINGPMPLMSSIQQVKGYEDEYNEHDVTKEL